MKKYILSILLSIVLIAAPTQKSHAIIWKIVTEAAKKIIKAIDLNIQRLQNKTIGLQNAQKELENLMAKLKLKEIGDWAEKQRKLYETYYNELKKVRDAIATYKKVRQIIEQQLALIKEYRYYYTRFKSSKYLSAQEIFHIADVYNGVIDESVKDLEQLYLVVNSLSTQMSDAKRLELINSAAEKIDGNYSDLKRFNRENEALIIQRTKEAMEINKMKELHGLK